MATLWTCCPQSYTTYKGLIAAQYSGTKVSTKSYKPDDKEFLDKFPLGTVPALETADGSCVAESNAVAYFLASDQLRGTDELERTQVLQWMTFADVELGKAADTWAFTVLGYNDYNETALKSAVNDVKRCLDVLNKVLLKRTFLVGERMTLADIGVACMLALVFQHVADPKFRKPYPNVVRWFGTVSNQPEVMKTSQGHEGAFTMAAEAMTYCPERTKAEQAKHGA